MSSCYSIVEDVRKGINDFSEEKLNGTEEGAFSNQYVLSKINNAQRYLYSVLIKRIPEQFLSSKDITGINSVYTLPQDFGRLIVFQDEYGRKVYSLKANQLKLKDASGSDRFYYRKGNALILDKDGVTKTYTLWYYRRPRDLIFGKATAGGANSITFASTASTTADYYNGLYLENVTQEWTYEITDYSTARVATVSGTAEANDYYGIISDLPEPFHFLISLKAIMDINAESPIAMRRTDRTDLALFQDQLSETISAFAPIADDDADDPYTDYDPICGGVW